MGILKVDFIEDFKFIFITVFVQKGDKVWVRNLRFSVTLTDFFTCSDFPKGWDPEGGVSAYPITKSVLFSAQITF